MSRVQVSSRASWKTKACPKIPDLEGQPVGAWCGQEALNHHLYSLGIMEKLVDLALEY
jgi:hypothetical protein